MVKLTVFLLLLSAALVKLFVEMPMDVLGVSHNALAADASGISEFSPVITTTTAFEQKETTEEEIIPFETKYEEDDDMEYGLEETVQEGKNGTKYYKYLLTVWEDEVIDKKLLSTEIVDPIEEIIAKGTKIVWRTLEGTEYGRVKYWHKIKVWATKYDGNCLGCTGRTYSGTPVKKGTCATDPKTIALGTNFYVPGYGICRAEDIGGGIKGNMIDLGYEDVSKGSWRTGWVDVYLLTNEPH